MRGFSEARFWNLGDRAMRPVSLTNPILSKWITALAVCTKAQPTTELTLLT
ncbi:hypothetical protein [Leptolyngbya sp. O-77]|uniref:hypothetical protein n=1 Tax=Leptolyngbya sp. O-77 TaxID=1080068 RepID=UPI000B104BA6|nr:hypothetical protein [Leptolyngbya sp. O-77]